MVLHKVISSTFQVTGSWYFYKDIFHYLLLKFQWVLW